MTSTTGAPSWVNGLTEEQRRAVEHGSGPLLVLAGAGSGKTRVLVSRIAHLATSGVARTDSILAITFTRKAAHEMRHRLEALIGFEDAANIAMGTFHALGVRILREFAGTLNLPPRFSVVDDHDIGLRVRKAMESLGLPKNLEHESPRDFRHWVLEAKRELAHALANSPPEGTAHLLTIYGEGWDSFWAEFADRHKVVNRDRLRDVYAAYTELCRQDAVLDYQDLLSLPLIVLATRPEVARMLSERWPYILVDEYQDTDDIQDRLLALLAGDERNLTVVGDDDQAIYRWRGADVRNILTFAHRYAPATTVRLGYNYRSSPEIVRSADAVLSDRPEVERLDKHLESVRPSGLPVRVWITSTPPSEALAIARDIREARRRGVLERLNDALVLYRLNRVGEGLEDAFRRERIPFRTTGRMPFASRAEVRDALALTRFLANPCDGTAFERIFSRMVSGVGAQTITRLRQNAGLYSRPLLEVCLHPETVDGLGGSRGARVREAAQVMADARDLCDECGVAHGLRTALEALGYRDRLLSELAASEEDEDEEAYFQSLERYQSLETFLRYVGDLEEMMAAEARSAHSRAADPTATLTPRERVAEALATLGMEPVAARADLDDDGGEAREHVRLMTVHAAKGLEAERVYVAGCEERIFPTVPGDRANADGTTEEERLHLAEEARLFYVAATRAKSQLILSASRTRTMLSGREEATMMSRFLRSLPQTLHRREDKETTKL